LVVGCWLLVVGCWLLVVGCWLLVVGSSLCVSGATGFVYVLLPACLYPISLVLRLQPRVSRFIQLERMSSMVAKSIPHADVVDL
jgi:hypothetical protein